jgi:hypothetical protein
VPLDVIVHARSCFACLKTAREVATGLKVWALNDKNILFENDNICVAGADAGLHIGTFAGVFG